jgi:hypothetical protein
MDEASEAVLALKPVTFRYKKKIDPAGTSQFGLVADGSGKGKFRPSGARQRRQTLHRPLRRGQRDVAQRVSQRASQERGAGSDNHRTEGE